MFFFFLITLHIREGEKSAVWSSLEHPRNILIDPYWKTCKKCSPFNDLAGMYKGGKTVDCTISLLLKMLLASLLEQ